MFLRPNHRNKDGKGHTYWSLVETVRTPDGPRQKTLARVLLNRVRLERTRQVGACFLGLDLLEIEDGKINDTRLYRCLDRILPHKTKLERHLKERYGALFGAEFDVLLYDLTSTYVEGAAEKNPMVRRGYSRDHRPDCEQLVIALIVNNEGFPFSYENFDGNRVDVSTMETILRMVERKYGKARRIWVFDRGIVSEENLAAIRKRDGHYLTGTPRSQMKQFEAELLKQDWTQVRPEVEVKKVAIAEGEETYILCRTSGRKEKEKAIRNRFSNRMETALKGLEKTIVAGRLKDRNKMERRLGKIQARHPQVTIFTTWR